MAEIVMERLLGKLGRQCYAVLCLGVVLLSLTIARYVNVDAAAAAAVDHRHRTERRLRALHGPPLVAVRRRA